MQTAGRSWGTSPVAVAEDPGTQWNPMEPNGTQWNLTIYKKGPFSAGRTCFLMILPTLPPAAYVRMFRSRRRGMNLKAFRFGFGWPLRMRAQRLTEVCPGPYIWASPGPGSVVVCLFVFSHLGCLLTQTS